MIFYPCGKNKLILWPPSRKRIVSNTGKTLISPSLHTVKEIKVTIMNSPLFLRVRKCSTVSWRISAFSNFPLCGSLAAAGTNLLSSPREAFILSRRFFSIIPLLLFLEACWQESPPGELHLKIKSKIGLWLLFGFFIFYSLNLNQWMAHWFAVTIHWWQQL